MKRRLRTFPLIAFGLAQLPSSARAQEPTLQMAGAHELSPMVVTATRTPEDPLSLPFSTSLLSVEDFARTLPRSLPEALRELPSVMIQKTANGQGSPYLRGFTGMRTLLLVDGIRLNNSTFRDGPNQYWNTVDHLALERVEVVRGPSSVLYGSDAIGGTVNAITPSTTALSPDGQPAGRTSYRYSSAEDSHVGRVEGATGAGEAAVRAGLSFKEFGDLRAGEETGLQSHTGFSEWDSDARVEWRAGEHGTVVFGHQSTDIDDLWRTHSTVFGKPWNGTVPGTDRHRILDQWRLLEYVQYHARDLPEFVQDLSVSLSYQLQDERESRARANGRREEQATEVDTLGFSLQATSDTRLGRWVYGTDYYHDWVESWYLRHAANGSVDLRRRQGPVADGSSYDLFGAFAENHLPFGNDRWETVVGGRFNLAHADATTAEDPFTGGALSLDQSWVNAVGSGRILWHADPDHRWTLFAGVSQGFRAPNLSDLTRFDIARAGEQEIPSFNLDPEHYLSFEAGVKVRRERVAAEASLFRTHIDDLIVRVPTGLTTPSGNAIVTKENSGEGQIHGAELQASFTIARGLELWGNLTWMEGEVEVPTIAGGPTAEEPVSRLMPTTFNTGLRWQSEQNRWWAELAGSFVRSQTRLSSGDRRDTERIPPGGTPGYEVLHLRAGWRPTAWLNLSVALENFTDEDYRVHGSGVNEAGRNLILAGDVRF